MVLIDPKQQMREYRISFVDNSIPVAAVLRLIEFRQSAVAIAAVSASLGAWLMKRP